MTASRRQPVHRRRAAARGRGEATAVRSMFDAIAPRYDLVNRIMTFRMDVGWRKRTVARRSRLPPRVARCSTWPAAPATSAASWRAAGLPPDRRRPQLRDARRAPAPTRRWSRPTPCASRCPTAPSTASRAASPCATSSTSAAFLAELGPGACDPAGASPCSRWPSPPNPVLRLGPRRLLRQGRAPDRRAAVRRRRLPLPAQVGRLPARARRRCSPLVRDAGFADAERTAAVRRHRPAASPGPAMAEPMAELVARTRRLDGDVDLLAAAGADGVLFERGRAGSPAGASPLRVPRRRGGRRRSPPSPSTTRSAARAAARWPSARCPSCPTARRRRARRARRSSGAGPRTAPAGSRRSARRGAVPAPVAARPPRPSAAPGRRFAVAPTRPAAEWCDARGRRHRGDRRSGGASRRSCWPARSMVEADAPFDRSAVLDPAAGRRTPAASSPGRRVRRRQPRAARRPGRRRRAGPADGRHRAPRRRPRRRRPAGRRAPGVARPTATSTR